MSLSEDLSPAKRKLLEQRLKGRLRRTGEAQGGLKKRPAEAPSLASIEQERIWLLQQMVPDSGVYNITSSFILEGAPVDVDVLSKSINAVIARHETLRTNFILRKDGLLQSIRQFLEVEVTLVDSSEFSSPQEALKPHAGKPFDLEKDPLVRVFLAKDGGSMSVLMFVFHDVIFEGWSIGILCKELSLFYNAYLSNEEPDIAPLDIQYADYAHWQRSGQNIQTIEDDVVYWSRQLAAPPMPLSLPTDRPYPPKINYDGRLAYGVLSDDVGAAVRKLASREGVSVFTVLLYGFNLLLNCYTNSEDLLVGTPVANRKHKDITHLIGFFLSTVALRSDLTGNPTLIEGLRRLKGVVQEALQHQDAPLDRVVDVIKPERVEGRHPLFQTLFIYQGKDEASPDIDLGETTSRNLFIETGYSKFDLSFFAAEAGEGMDTILEYRTDLFDPISIERMLKHYENVMRQLTLQPEMRLGELDLLDEDERNSLLLQSRGTTLSLAEYPSIVDGVADRVTAHPSSRAVVTGDSILTYSELDACSANIAQFLLGRGLEAGQQVALFLPRSPMAIASILGVLRAGGTYLPVDPEYPNERIQFQLEDCGAKYVVSDSHHVQKLPSLDATEIIDIENLKLEPDQIIELPEIDPSGSAYTIYTSGSTGRPKGVVVTHENLLNSTVARLAHYSQTPGNFLLIPSLAFDSSIAGIFWTLYTGGTLIIPTQAELRDPKLLGKLIGRLEITSLLCVPSLYRELLNWNANVLDSLKLAIVAGESCPTSLVEKHFSILTDCELHNEYGPTEATVWSTVHQCRPEDAKRERVSIGRPISNTAVYLLDSHGRLLPNGIAGEIWIGGSSVSRGYFGRSGLTGERFRVWNGLGRLYRSGDLAKREPGGALVFLGRNDEQVKVRGYRIELGEIENSLMQHPAIREAVVIAYDGKGKGAGSDFSRMAAFVIMKGQPECDPIELRGFLLDRLPGYMVPGKFEPVYDFPKTSNGKVDRDHMREGLISEEALRDNGIEAMEAFESGSEGATLLAIFREALDDPTFGPQDNFFHCGGDSLLAINIVTKALQVGMEINFEQLFSTPTVAQLLDDKLDKIEDFVIPIRTGGNRVPYVFLHPLGGQINIYWTLAKYLPEDQPIYAIRCPDKAYTGLEEMTDDYLKEVLKLFPDGSFRLAGYCFGAALALRMAQKLKQLGMPQKQIVVMDFMFRKSRHYNTRLILEILREEFPVRLFRRVFFKIISIFKRCRRAILEPGKGFTPQREDDFGHTVIPEENREKYNTHFSFLRSYQPKAYDGEVMLILSDSVYSRADKYIGWAQVVEKKYLRVEIVPSSHEHMVKEPDIAMVGEILSV